MSFRRPSLSPHSSISPRDLRNSTSISINGADNGSSRDDDETIRDSQDANGLRAYTVGTKSSEASGSQPRRRSRAASAASALLRPLDLSAPPAPPPQSLEEQRQDQDFRSEDSRAVAPEELTAYQFPDGRVKIHHPGIGARTQTFHPHHIESIQEKNDLQKSDIEKAIEGEAALHPNDEGKIVLTQRAGYLATAYSFDWRRKWLTLFLTGLIQISMNFNTSVYPNAVSLISDERHVSEQAARVGQMIYLVAYAFGCELWAPWSEEFGRKPILQLSLLCCNLMQILAACAPNFGSIIVARFFGGLFTANGGVTLAVVADMYEPDDHQFALAFIVLLSCFGITSGGFIGSFLEARAPHAKWNFWTQMALNAAVQVVHFLFAPETRATILLDREARRRRRNGEQNIWGPNEAESNRLSPRRLFSYWIRPFQMLVYEPIVACCCALSGFSDMLIYIFQESFPLVFHKGWPGHRSWNFTTIEVGLCFLAVIVGYSLAYTMYLPRWAWELKRRKNTPSNRPLLAPEARLTMLLYLAPGLPIGLFGFAWTSTGPPIHWIAPLIFSAVISIANYSIYYGTIDYMIAAYGPYSASACGGNAFSRDLLAGVSSMFSVPMYQGMNGYQWSSTFLAFMAIIVVIPIYVFFFKGPKIRSRSMFAQALAADRAANEGKNPDYNYEAEHGSIYNRSATATERNSPASTVRRGESQSPDSSLTSGNASDVSSTVVSPEGEQRRP